MSGYKGCCRGYLPEIIFFQMRMSISKFQGSVKEFAPLQSPLHQPILLQPTGNGQP